MKIKFIYSPQYEDFVTNGKSKLAFKDVEKIILKLEKFWSAYEKKISTQLYKSTGLKFPKSIQICYLNSKGSVSNPLSLKIENIDDMKDNLVHELMHVFLMYNYKKIKVGWNKMWKKYDGEIRLTKTHITVHALHYILTKKCMPTRLNKIINYSKHKAYRRSWYIVQKEGANTIIKMVFEK